MVFNVVVVSVSNAFYNVYRKPDVVLHRGFWCRRQ